MLYGVSSERGAAQKKHACVAGNGMQRASATVRLHNARIWCSCRLGGLLCVSPHMLPLFIAHICLPRADYGDTKTPGVPAISDLCTLLKSQLDARLAGGRAPIQVGAIWGGWLPRHAMRAAS